MNIFIKNHFESHSTKPFLSFEDSEYSFAAVYQKAFSIAEKLKQIGLESGDRIIIRFWNEPDFIFAYFGVLLSGGIAVTVSPMLTQSELTKIQTHSGARLILSFEDATISNKDTELHQISLEKLLNSLYFNSSISLLEKGNTNNVSKDLPQDLAVLIYTSGTTASPKGVMLTYANIKAQLNAAGKVLEINQSDSLLGILSLSHVFGQMDVLWLALFYGLKIHLISKFEASHAIKTLREKEISILIAVPTMYQLMLKYLDNDIYSSNQFSKLRVCHSGASYMSPQLFQKVEKSFGSIVQEGYGLTETCSMAFSNPLNGIRKPGSVGKPIEGVEVILLDENNNQIERSSSEENNEIGEICIRGQIVTKGYFGSPEETQKAIFTETEHKNLWLRTGDLGFVDKDGYLFLVDRKKDLIIHSGHKVYPREVEEVLEKHPLVDQVAVIGVLAGELHGEKIKAFVVLKSKDAKNKILSDEHKDQLKIELKNFCKKELAKFKVPNFFKFIDEIPKTPSGKLKRLDLRNKK